MLRQASLFLVKCIERSRNDNAGDSTYCISGNYCSIYVDVPDYGFKRTNDLRISVLFTYSALDDGAAVLIKN